MAENDKIFDISGLNPQTSFEKIYAPDGSMKKDIKFDGKSWGYALNAVNNTFEGEYLLLGSEPSTKFITSIVINNINYTIIGGIYLFDNIWVLFSTIYNDISEWNNSSSTTGCAISLFNPNNIGTNKEVLLNIIDDRELKFVKTHLPKGVSRINCNNEVIIYWDDGLNNTRYLNLGNPERWDWNNFIGAPQYNLWVNQNYVTVPYIKHQNSPCDLPFYPQPYRIDIEELNLIKDITFPKLYLKQDNVTSGTLPNGTYIAAIAYVDDNTIITDYFSSNVAHVYSRDGVSGSLHLSIDNLDTGCDKYRLIILMFSGQELVCKHFGTFDITNKEMTIDTIPKTAPTENPALILFNRSRYKKSNGCYRIGNVLARIHPYRRQEINYQPLANLIISHAIIAEAPEDYYARSGNMVGYLRDEVYSFYIRWIYKDGTKTPSYVIPGPIYRKDVCDNVWNAQNDSAIEYFNTNNLTIGGTFIPYEHDKNYLGAIGLDSVQVLGNVDYNWDGQNLRNDSDVKPKYRASMLTFISLERYRNNPLVWNLYDSTNTEDSFVNWLITNVNGFIYSQEYQKILNAIAYYNNYYYNSSTDQTYNLCGKRVRLHRFPCGRGFFNGQEFFIDELYDKTNKKIRILGVQFSNILPPIGYDGKFIEDIYGYEILRADRNGNKRIIAKGILNSYGQYSKVQNEDVFLQYVNVTDSAVGSYDKIYLYQNFPLNCVQPNTLLTLSKALYRGNINFGSGNLFIWQVPLFMSTLNIGGNTLYYGYNNYDMGFSEVLKDHSAIQIFTNSGYLIDQNVNFLHNTFSRLRFSFHSPDTVFKKPFLGINISRIYNLLLTIPENTTDLSYSTLTLQYFIPENVTKFKLYPSSIFKFLTFLSIGSTLLKLNGKVIYENAKLIYNPEAIKIHDKLDFFGPFFPRVAAMATVNLGNNIFYPLITTMIAGGVMLNFNALGWTPSGILQTLSVAQLIFGKAAAQAGAGNFIPPIVRVEMGEWASLPRQYRVLFFIPYFLTHLTLEMYKSFQVLDMMTKYQNYCITSVTLGSYQYFKYIFNNDFMKYLNITKKAYVSNDNVSIDKYIIMNRDRNRHVFLEYDNKHYRTLDSYFNFLLSFDTSRKHIRGIISDFSDPYIWREFGYTNSYRRFLFTQYPWNYVIHSLKSATAYASIAVSNDDVYRPITEQTLIPISYITKLTDFNNNNVSWILFGGDTYIGRYSERNPFHFFNTYLFGAPDGTDINYLEHRSILFPRFWLSSEVPSILDIIYDVFNLGTLNASYTHMIQENINFVKNFTGLNVWNILGGGILQSISHNSNWVVPVDIGAWLKLFLFMTNYNLDGCPNLFKISNTRLVPWNIFKPLQSGFIHLCMHGIREFWVESEINLAFREMGESITEKFYCESRFSALGNFVKPENIRLEDYYKYDWSLSVSRLYLILGSFSYCQSIYFDVIKESNALSGLEYNKIIFSLIQSKESKVDNWRNFLPMSYMIFDDEITCLTDIDEEQGIVFFRNSAPVLLRNNYLAALQEPSFSFYGSRNVFIAKPLGKISEAQFEHSSLQHAKAVLKTPYGVYYFSTRGGKLYKFISSTPIEVSDIGTMKWWLEYFSEFKLLQYFPDFELTDNTIIGIGSMLLYDYDNGILYISKKDYKPVEDVSKYKYLGNNKFLIDEEEILLGDPRYFENCSWTLSFDPKLSRNGAFVSFHSWHPDLFLGAPEHMFTVKGSTIWEHNNVCDSYCVFYGVPKPFIVEVNDSDLFNVATIRNIEVYSEVYVYDNDNCFNKFHVLDDWFDYCIIYNSEQCSGMLKLNLEPKGNPFSRINYPIFQSNYVDILYSKNEQKYRLNDIFDLVKDRGEYSGAQNKIFLWADDGYTFSLNPAAIDYNKSPIERKKIRHFSNNIILIKNYSLKKNKNKIIVYAVKVKKLLSAR